MKPATRPQRADAARNREAILDATLTCLSRDPRASMAAIAAEAGVGRVTLYGHFSSRAELVEAVLVHVLEHSDDALHGVDTDGSAREAMGRLIGSSWQILDTFRLALAAAESELDAETIRRHHEAPMRRVESLITRGRRDGEFRTDLPTAWLVACFYSTLHAAAGEITAGRLPEADATRVITATLESVLRP
jgi:AcrR family transcriptional regulator